ncbi:DUF1328 domain-containing protein [Pigmentibacter ruber]|uniref:DUF1328 domain-containing protein n=1 Tax=Pigmentibacter ruber TaxID=2683196 RepID=UPI00131E1C43|nr:DUF1328 domain-containing protein [Pigmentibacter ruber]BFD32281.1 hypothetical protein GTC16762_18990 [Pigmentibacter ruber]
MLRWALGFLGVSLVAAFCGFYLLAHMYAYAAKIIFIIFLVLSILSFIDSFLERKS